MYMIARRAPSFGVGFFACPHSADLHSAGAQHSRLAQLPYSYTGVYWTGMFDGPLTAAAYFAQTFMLQAASGLTPAWGRLRPGRLGALYALRRSGAKGAPALSCDSAPAFKLASAAPRTASAARTPPKPRRRWREMAR